MHSLRELQLAFLDAVLADAPERAVPLLRAPAGHDAAAAASAQRVRVGVYAHNVVANAAHALGLGFPIVRALGGREWFEGTVREYLRAHPSRSGDLHGLGERFPQFLAARLGDGPHAYFADVARLEWAYQQVVVAADAAPLDLAALATVPAERHAELVFVPHPASRLVNSAWPILDVWRAHRVAAGRGSGGATAPRPTPEPAPDAEPDAEPALASPVDLAGGAQRVLVVRRADHVELAPATADEAAFYAACAAGTTLGEAVDALGADFPLGATLAALARRGVLAGFHLATAAEPKRPGRHGTSD